MTALRPGTRVVGVALAAAVGLAACTGTGDTPPARDGATTGPADARGTTTAEGVAAGFMEAYGAFEAERAIGYLADAADISGIVSMAGDPSVTGSLRDFRLVNSFFEAQGYEQMLGSCTELDGSASGTTLRCPFVFHLLGSDEIGRGPYRGSSFHITVLDGAIARASLVLTYGNELSMWGPFDEWVSTTHPEDAAIMYTDGTHSGARLTEDSVRLWKKRTQQYVEIETAEMVETAERFLRARNAYDVEEAVSLLADGAVASQLLYDNGLHADMGAVRLHPVELALAFEAEQLYGIRYKSVECHQASQVLGANGQAQVSCSYQMDSTLRQIDGLAPVEASFGIGFRKGRIDHLSFPWLNVSWGPEGVFPAEFASFFDWLDAEHPRAGTAMHSGEVFRSQGQELIHVLTRKSLELLAGYLAEYGRSVSS